MKSLLDFKTILTEEEKSDYTKFDALVRAGLANKAQIQRMHKILDKMGEERPQFTNADRMIIQNLFTKMVDLITNNKQIYSQTRRAVREDLEEGVVDTSDYKLGAAGQKVRAHRVKVGDTAPQVGTMAPEVGDDAEQDQDRTKKLYKENIDSQALPFVLVLRRKAVRMYPEGTRVALYYNERLNRYFSVPYSSESLAKAPIQAEEVTTQIQHDDGTVSDVDAKTISMLMDVYDGLNEHNRTKFIAMVESSSEELNKAIEFASKIEK